MTPFFLQLSSSVSLRTTDVTGIVASAEGGDILHARRHAR